MILSLPTMLRLALFDLARAPGSLPLPELASAELKQALTDYLISCALIMRCRPEDAADAAHDTLRKFVQYLKYETVSEIENVKAWIDEALRRVIYDRAPRPMPEKRKDQPHPGKPVQLDTALDLPGRDTAPPSARFIVDDLYAFLYQQHPRWLGVFDLYRAERARAITHEYAAEVLGVSRAKWLRWVEILKRMLREAGGGY